MNLLRRHQEVREQTRKAERTRGSGWHPADEGAEKREKAGEAPLSERPIILQFDDEVFVVAESAAAVKAALRPALDATLRSMAAARADPDEVKKSLDFAKQQLKDQLKLAEVGAIQETEPVAPDAVPPLYHGSLSYTDQVAKACQTLLAQDDAMLNCTTKQWNYANTALQAVGVHVVSAAVQA
jgi:hypothetical protein